MLGQPADPPDGKRMSWKKNDFERCADLREWRLTHAGDLPRRRSDNDVEKSLASWLSKALQRRERALGDYPSQQQLTPDQAVHLNSIVGMAIGPASAHATASESSDTASEQPPAASRKRMRHEAVEAGPTACEILKQLDPTQEDYRRRLELLEVWRIEEGLLMMVAEKPENIRAQKGRITFGRKCGTTRNT